MIEWILAFLVTIGVFLFSFFAIYFYYEHPKIGKIIVFILILIGCTAMWHSILF